MPQDTRSHACIPEQPPDPPAIRGLDTTTAAFLGLAHDGPIGIPSPPLAGLTEFTELYGDGRSLCVGGLTIPAYLWHAARAFFAEGGCRLYIVRVASNTRLPTSDDYVGLPAGTGPATGLAALEAIDSIATVAAPGATAAIMNVQTNSGTSVAAALIAHAEAMRYRFAVLDSGDQDTLDHVLARRSLLNSSFAALYYPWLTVDDPASPTPLPLPPSGFVAGIFARNDFTRGIAHAPANETVQSASDLAVPITSAAQAILNPAGIDAIRSFPGRGIRIWGARTVSNDPEWKYINIRRTLIYLEASIAKGTQWVVFEPNGAPLWSAIRTAITNFLTTEWINGTLMGAKPEEAYFVRCDQTTMTQDDIDQGRLVCLIGVALIEPAEFVIFRIGQWTADSNSTSPTDRALTPRPPNV